MIKPFELESPNILKKFLLFKISAFINNKSSSTEYNELSTEENKLENKLLMVWVIDSTIFTWFPSKKIHLFYATNNCIAARIKSIAKIKA